MIQARVKAGLERTKASAKSLGRPKSPPYVESHVQRLLGEKVGKKRIARQLGVRRIAAVVGNSRCPQHRATECVT